MANSSNQPVTFTAKITEAKAFEAGLVVLKVYLSKDQLASVGCDTEKAGSLVQIKLQRYEYEAWREDQETFPKVFGTFQFTCDAIEHRHLNADMTVGRMEDLDWLEVVGFMPDGHSTGRALLPEFDKLVVKRPAKQDSKPKGF